MSSLGFWFLFQQMHLLFSGFPVRYVFITTCFSSVLLQHFLFLFFMNALLPFISLRILNIPFKRHFHINLFHSHFIWSQFISSLFMSLISVFSMCFGILVWRLIVVRFYCFSLFILQALRMLWSLYPGPTGPNVDFFFLHSFFPSLLSFLLFLPFLSFFLSSPFLLPSISEVPVPMTLEKVLSPTQGYYFTHFLASE